VDPVAGVRLALAFSGTLLLAPPVSAAPAETVHRAQPAAQVSDADACLDSEEVAFLGDINDYRAASGLRPLSVSASLSSAAAYHSIDMAANGYLSHTLLDGTGVQQNMANFGYQGGAWGENIAAGMATASEALQLWQNSPEHNANMLNGQFGAIGIGRAYDAASPHGWYWTTIFGDVSDGPGWLCGESAPASKTLSLFQSVDSAVAQTDINLRSGPGESYDLVASLPPDTPMTVTGAEQEGYLPVKVDGQFGWVGAEWVQRGAVDLQQTADASQPGTATALSAVELFTGPDDASGILSSIPSSAVVTLTGEAQDGYLEVSYDGQQGWADAAYLQVADTASSTQLLQPAVADDSATEASSAAPAPASTLGKDAVTTANINLRSQPNANAVVLEILPAGSEVTLTGSRANGYANVRINGQAGWIDEAYLQ
jgi:uncharacterized protein YkwD/uncharacterized protein YraI